MLHPFEIRLSLPDASSSTNRHRSTTKAHSVFETDHQSAAIVRLRLRMPVVSKLEKSET